MFLSFTRREKGNHKEKKTNTKKEFEHERNDKKKNVVRVLYARVYEI